MSILKGIGFLTSSRGIAKGIKRLKTVRRRFGLTPSKQMGIIHEFVDCLKAHQVKGTFFIPAVLLERYKKELSVLDPAVIEWGIHGFVHTDHSQLTFDEQYAYFQKAIAAFDKNGIKFSGFRCPYLKFNEHTFKALKKTGRFDFDSSECIIWDEFYPSTEKHYPWMQEFYKPRPGAKECNSHERDGLVEFTVSLPDDDILVDREQLSASSVLKIWEKVLKRCHETNDIFVLQLHPERFRELKDALEGLIRQAKACNPPVMITTVNEVARWRRKQSTNSQWSKPYQGIFCISGDIDAITVGNFLCRLKEW